MNLYLQYFVIHDILTQRVWLQTLQNLILEAVPTKSASHLVLIEKNMNWQILRFLWHILARQIALEKYLWLINFINKFRNFVM